VTEGARISRRTTAWLAWALGGLSVALVAGGVALAWAVRSTAPELPNGSTGDADPVVLVALAIVLTFSVVGAIVASRQPTTP